MVWKPAKSASEVKEAFSDFLLNAEAEPSRRRAIEDFGQAMLTSNWIESESEDTTITEFTAPLQCLMTFDKHTIYSMVTKVKRTVYEQPFELGFYLALPPIEQVAKTITYRHVLGSGRLSEDDLGEIRQIVSSAPIAEVGIPELFEISNLHVRAGKMEARTNQTQEDRVGHYRGLTYECHWDKAVDGPYTIEFEVKSICFEQHGWHTYRTHHGISKKLWLSLDSPKKLDCFCDVWPRRDLDTRPVPIGKRYRSVLSLDGPVFAGSTVRWVWHEQKGRQP